MTVPRVFPPMPVILAGTSLARRGPRSARYLRASTPATFTVGIQRRNTTPKLRRVSIMNKTYLDILALSS